MLAFIVAIATALDSSAYAQPSTATEAERDKQLAIWAGYGDSDNIGRTSQPESGTYTSLGLFLGLERQSARLDTGIQSDIEYRTYGDDMFENETVGTLDARALVDLVIDRFAWNFQGNIDQGQQDPFAARGPNNRETIKYANTGPRLDIPFGRTSLAVSAARAAYRYEESSHVDNDSEDYRIALSRQARPSTSFALVAGSSETEYLDAGASTYRIDQLFVRIEKTLSRGSLNADLGSNEIRSDTQIRRDPLFNASWNRLFGGRSNIAITAAQGFTGAGNAGLGDNALVTTAPFEQESLGVDYGLDAERTTVTVGYETGREDYAGGESIDNDYQSANFGLAYAVTMRLDVGVRYERFKRDYQTIAPSPSQEDRTGGVWLNRTIGRRFSVALDVSRYEALGSERVEETRAEVRFTYSPTGDTASPLSSIGR